MDYCHSTCLLFPKQLSLLTNANAMSSRNAAGTASLFRDRFLSFFLLTCVFCLHESQWKLSFNMHSLHQADG